MYEEIKNNSEWKAIQGTNNSYYIHRSGKVFSTITNKILKPQTISSGYCQLNLRYEKGYKLKLVHRLVAQHFLNKMDYQQFVNHLNCNKRDNRAENLEWCSQSENMRHYNYIKKFLEKVDA